MDERFWLVVAEFGHVVLGQRPGLLGQGVGVLGLSHGRLRVVPGDRDRLLKVPVRFGQPRPGRRINPAAPGGDEVFGRGNGTAGHEHDLVENGPGPVLTLRFAADHGEGVVEGRVGLLKLAEGGQGIERRTRRDLVANVGRGGPGPVDHGGPVIGLAGQQCHGLRDLDIDLPQRGGQGRGGLGELGLQVLDAIEQRLRLVGCGLGRLQVHRRRAVPPGG
jgi:hypothetical protein